MAAKHSLNSLARLNSRVPFSPILGGYGSPVQKGREETEEVMTENLIEELEELVGPYEKESGLLVLDSPPIIRIEKREK